MTIQRQYSLPNCKLILEGLGEEVPSMTNPAAGRPMLSVLMNAECHFVGHPTPLSGGRDFLDHLVAAVSGYAQECLSGVPHADAHGTRTSTVGLQKLSAHQHRLTVYSKAEGGPSSEPRQVDLQTLQLFDLVEAIDQFLADPQTLPDLSLNLTPVSKRYATTHAPVSKRVVPAAVGVSSLAIAATALFFMPIPDMRPPEPRPTTTEESSGSATPTGETTAASPPAAPPTDVEASPTVAPTPEDTSSVAGSDSEEAGRSEVLAADASSSLDQRIDTAPMIDDLSTLERLNDELRDTLSGAWDREDADFPEDLEFRVGVAENGDILGYKQTNDAALAYADQTPLQSLLYIPVGDSGSEPMAQFKVLFRTNGAIEVSPWHGWPSDNAQ